MTTKIHNPLITGILLIAIPITAFIIVTKLQQKYEQLPVYNDALPGLSSSDAGQHFIQPFRLTNQDGENFSSETLTNRIYVADFFFTSCLSVCPQMTSNLKLLQEAFAKDGNVEIVSFTVDPQRDSVAKLKQYEQRFKLDGNNWNLLTGNKKDIYQLARKSFYASASDGDGGENDFIHSDKLILVDKKSRIRGYYTGTKRKDVELLINDIKKLENE